MPGFAWQMAGAGSPCGRRRRFLASLPIARSVAKFGYSFDRAEVEPCYIQPLLLEAREPSDEEIERGARSELRGGDSDRGD